MSGAAPPPVIGLSSYRERARWGVWDQPADLLPCGYADAVVLAGGAPVLLPVLGGAGNGAALAHVATAAVDRVDGLVVTGGADVDPTRYGEQPHPRTLSWRTDRDAWELALLDAAQARGIPVLGICRGMQLMAVHAGGMLDQHTPELVGHDGHDPGHDEFGDTTVTIAPGSRLADAVGDALAVRCHHHQSVREHPGFVAVAHARDGALEAMEAPGRRFCLAVQWHPEVTTDAGLFRALVAAAATSVSPSRVPPEGSPGSD
ncbi:MAG TPA: gamma-glutamyl-gamma-aminobutyrate hydrolase family protein [Marmoricola sp.]|nr:gamma-glutamyl-gamma-aminobutyrate hydrolase family protein [Marmoricola sp.]